MPPGSFEAKADRPKDSFFDNSQNLLHRFHDATDSAVHFAQEHPLEVAAGVLLAVSAAGAAICLRGRVVRNSARLFEDEVSLAKSSEGLVDRIFLPSKNISSAATEEESLLAKVDADASLRVLLKELPAKEQAQTKKQLLDIYFGSNSIEEHTASFVKHYRKMQEANEILQQRLDSLLISTRRSGSPFIHPDHPSNPTDLKPLLNEDSTQFSIRVKEHYRELLQINRTILNERVLFGKNYFHGLEPDHVLPQPDHVIDFNSGRLATIESEVAAFGRKYGFAPDYSLALHDARAHCIGIKSPATAGGELRGSIVESVAEQMLDSRGASPCFAEAVKSYETVRKGLAETGYITPHLPEAVLQKWFKLAEQRMRDNFKQWGGCPRYANFDNIKHLPVLKKWS